MQRYLRLIAAIWLGLGLVFMPAYGPTARADDDNTESTPDDADDPEDLDSTIDGLVYRIRTFEGAQVVTVYDRNVGQGGLGVDVYVRDPKLVALITSNTLCVGRYIVAQGDRTGRNTLDAQGITVDFTHACGQPPK